MTDVRGGAGFPKRLRLRRRREFLAVQRGGGRVTSACFIFYARRNGGRPTRLGITVSRKVGKAVQRNRIKRLVREAFRLNRASLPAGFDLVLVARPGARPKGLAAVTAALLEAAPRIHGAQSRGRGRRRTRR